MIEIKEHDFRGFIDFNDPKLKKGPFGLILCNGDVPGCEFCREKGYVTEVNVNLVEDLRNKLGTLLDQRGKTLSEYKQRCEELERWEDDAEALLRQMKGTAVRVCEGGAAEDIRASLSVSVVKLIALAEELSVKLDEANARNGKLRIDLQDSDQILKDALGHKDAAVAPLRVVLEEYAVSNIYGQAARTVLANNDSGRGWVSPENADRKDEEIRSLTNTASYRRVLLDQQKTRLDATRDEVERLRKELAETKTSLTDLLEKTMNNTLNRPILISEEECERRCKEVAENYVAEITGKRFPGEGTDPQLTAIIESVQKGT